MDWLRKINIELICWIAGLGWLAFSDPTLPHYSFCIFKQLGFRYCPGCGLGHSISFLMRGDLSASFHAHPLGVPAFIILINRIRQLSIMQLKKLGYNIRPLNFKLKSIFNY